MNLYPAVESQLTSLERLVPHLTRHGCDSSAQDAALSLIRYFDALASAYAAVRHQLKDIAEGRSGSLPVSNVAVFTRCYREHLLRGSRLD